MPAPTRLTLAMSLAILLAGSAGSAPAPEADYPGAKSYIGQWEYESGGHKFRREFRADGTAQIWSEGKVFLHPSGKSWWMGMRWRYDEGIRAIVILNPDQAVNSIMQANPRNHDILREVCGRIIARRVPAGMEWTGHGHSRPAAAPRAEPGSGRPSPAPVAPERRPPPPNQAE